MGTSVTDEFVRRRRWMKRCQALGDAKFRNEASMRRVKCSGGYMRNRQCIFAFS